jgi:3-methyladenine DNA glycosylase AlkD
MKASPDKRTPALTPEAYVRLILDLFLKVGDPIRAEQQRAYMQHQFDFCGLGAPQWLSLLKEIFGQHGTFTGKKLDQFVRLCYEQEYREMHYAGLEMMQKRLQEQNQNWILVLERCIQTHSWWDSVDWLAKLTGIHFKNFPELQYPYCEKWIDSHHMWLQRVAIIHQLLYKEKTDEKLLFALIKKVASSKEFFIQKACGWALRQYAKINPVRVQWFLDKNTLSKLTVREAMKQLKA